MKKNCRLYSDPPKSNKNHHKSLNQNAESSFLIKIYIHQVNSTTQTIQLTTPKTHKTQINQSKLSTHSISRQLSPTFKFKHTQFLISHIPLSPSFQRGVFFPNFFSFNGTTQIQVPPFPSPALPVACFIPFQHRIHVHTWLFTSFRLLLHVERLQPHIYFK